jgi:hypothetical protein
MMKRTALRSILIPAGFLFFLAAACILPGFGTESTPTPAPVPLWQQVTLGSTPYEESGLGPDYTLTTHTPVLTGSDDLRVTVFNQQMTILVQEEVDRFRQLLADMPDLPIAAGSFLDLDFALVSPPGNLYSLLFTVQFYADGAAHPGSYHLSVTYDLEAGEFLSLEQLFLPGADYLDRLSERCIADLSTRDIGFDMFSSGAEPAEANYAVWNVTAAGLQITFEEYQVAAYAAGPQTVLVPYEQLADLLDPAGPLQDLIP